jgi:hypothetical protein
MDQAIRLKKKVGWSERLEMWPTAADLGEGTLSKYDLLGQHLAALRLDQWRPTFREIEAVLGFSFPASARIYPAWWSNGSGTRQSAAWLDVGWRTEDLALGSERVTFRRSVLLRLKATPAVKRTPRHETGSHEWDRSAVIKLQLGMEWKPIGRVMLDDAGRLVFPAVPRAPGLYRFRFRAAGREGVYIGESDNLARRFAHYRNPGPTQQTNLRLNAKFKDALAAGAEISVATISANAWIERSGHRQTADLSSKAVRCLFENAALLDGGKDVDALNRSLVSS